MVVLPEPVVAVVVPVVAVVVAPPVPAPVVAPWDVEPVVCAAVAPPEATPEVTPETPPEPPLPDEPRRVLVAEQAAATMDARSENERSEGAWFTMCQDRVDRARRSSGGRKSRSRGTRSALRIASEGLPRAVRAEKRSPAGHSRGI